jgi:cytochrome c5
MKKFGKLICLVGLALANAIGAADKAGVIESGGTGTARSARADSSQREEFHHEPWKLPPDTAKLERGQGVEVVTAQCSLCHSADYISIQPPMNRAAWTATVTKMREKYGAPILTNSVDQIVTYLVKTYGTEKTAK